MPNPDQMRKATGTSPSDPDKEPVASATPAVMGAMGLDESNATPASMKAPAAETNPMPNTNAVARAIGLGETDVAPGISPPSSAPTPMAPPDLEKPTAVATKTKDIPTIGGTPSLPSSAPSPMEVIQSGPGGAGVSPQDAKAIASDIKADPNVGQQLLQFAKNAGVSVLEAIQGFAKGYSGSNIPLQSQVREAEKLATMPIEAEKQRQIAEQQFQSDLARIQNEWTQKRFEASTKQEKDLAQQKMQQEVTEAAKDRAARLEEAKIQRTPTNWEQMQYGNTRMAQLRSIIAQALQGGKVE